MSKHVTEQSQSQTEIIPFWLKALLFIALFFFLGGELMRAPFWNNLNAAMDQQR